MAIIIRSDLEFRRQVNQFVHCADLTSNQYAVSLAGRDQKSLAEKLPVVYLFWFWNADHDSGACACILITYVSNEYQQTCILQANPNPLSITMVLNGYHSRFFVQVGHETTYASIDHKHFFTKSCHRQTYQNY